MKEEKITENEEMVPTVIDFSKMRNEEGELNESWVLTFGAALRWIMPSLFKGGAIQVQIRGNKSQISNFANVLSKEKRFLQKWRDHGLDSPATYRSKSQLRSAINKFERATGLKWPFK